MYFYHGYSLGVASTIPGKEFTEAVCALSVRGGNASAKSKNFSQNGIKFASAESTIAGTEAEVNGLDVYTTTASVVVKKLDIFGKFTADAIEARLISQHRVGDYEPSIVITGSKLLGLTINGNPVNPDPVLSNELSARYPTFGSMQTDFQDGFSR